MYAGIPGRRLSLSVGAGPAGAPRVPTRPSAAVRHSGGVRSRPSPRQVPDAPGSYQFLDADGRVLYVGKAKSLRSRLANYFADPATLAPRTAQMVASAERVEWIQVDNEVEAILLEYALIKRHRPRFNIRLADDKSYPSLAVTVADEWPRAAVVRGRRRAGVRYFGPYAHVGAIRDTLDLLRRTFPVRTCSDSKLDRHVKLGKPCLLFHIERCSGPCIEAVERDRYDAMVRDLMAFLAGDTDEVERRLTTEMEEAAEALDFERAARLRDRLHTLHMACERQQVVTERPEDLDVVGMEEDALEAAVCVLHVRRGRIVGRRGFVVDRVEDLTTAQLVGRVLEELYGDAVPAVSEPRRARVRGGDSSGWTSGAGDPRSRGNEGVSAPEVPRQVLVPEMPDPASVYEAFLVDRRGGPVALRVPRRGGKRALLQTAARNAAEELTRHRLRRASDHASRARALESLQQVLGLAHAPLRIECYDMSHLQGTDYVGSMVVLEDGLPRKSEYRRFRLKGVAGNDDYAAMEEVLTRRLTALLAAAGRDPGRGRGGGQRPGPALRLSAPAAPPGRGQGTAGGGGAGLGATGPGRRDPRGRPGQVLRGGVRAGARRPRARAPGLGRPLPVAAGARRGAPLRHHLSPRPAGQAHDGQRPGGGPRPGADPAHPPAAGDGRGAGRAGRLGGGPAGTAVAPRRRGRGRARPPAPSPPPAPPRSRGGERAGPDHGAVGGQRRGAQHPIGTGPGPGWGSPPTGHAGPGAPVGGEGRTASDGP